MDAPTIAPEIGYGTVVSAILDPIDTRDLSPEARAVVGQRFEWTAEFVISEDDGVGYVGQWRMSLGREDHERTGLWWAPLCDLTDIEILPGRGEYNRFRQWLESP